MPLSLESANPKQQEVAKALVIVMADDPLRTSLLDVLQEGGKENKFKEHLGEIIKEEQKFNTEEVEIKTRAETSTRSHDWGDWDYDIFWCEKSKESGKKQAEEMVAKMKAKTKGRLRIRKLPDSINARPDYHLNGFSIRYNTGEEKQAEELKKLGEETLGVAFEKNLSRQSTRWYISAFICP